MSTMDTSWQRGFSVLSSTGMPPGMPHSRRSLNSTQPECKQQQQQPQPQVSVLQLTR
jgi:hypothetical protein